MLVPYLPKVSPIIGKFLAILSVWLVDKGKRFLPAIHSDIQIIIWQRISQGTSGKFLVQKDTWNHRERNKPCDIKNILLPTTKVNIVRPKVPVIVPIGRSFMESFIETKKWVVRDWRVREEKRRSTEFNARSRLWALRNSPSQQHSMIQPSQIPCVLGRNFLSGQ